jgi:hypothetical protein
MMKRCDRCFYWEEGAGSGQGVCRVDPPKAVPVGQNKLGQMQVMTIWPSVPAENFCHKHDPTPRIISATRLPIGN